MHAHAQLINGLVAVAALGIILRRALRTQTMRVWMLFALPLLVVAVAAGAVVAAPPATPVAGLAVAAGALAGAALGYLRGRHSRVTLGPRPGTLVVQGNVLLAVILVAAFAVRFALRPFLGTTGLGRSASDGLVVFAAMSVAVARGMLFVSWRRLRAARALVPS